MCSSVDCLCLVFVIELLGARACLQMQIASPKISLSFVVASVALALRALARFERESACLLFILDLLTRVLVCFVQLYRWLFCPTPLLSVKTDRFAPIAVCRCAVSSLDHWQKRTDTGGSCASVATEEAFVTLSTEESAALAAAFQYGYAYCSIFTCNAHDLI